MTIDASQPEVVPLPMCDQAEFDELVSEMVTDEAPRLFAVVHELGDRADGWITAWGMAFRDHVKILRPGGALKLSSPEHVLQVFGRQPHLKPHLVWLAAPPVAENRPASG